MITYYNSVLMLMHVNSVLLYRCVHLCLGDDGDSSNDLCLVGDLFFGPYNIWQSLLVLCIMLSIRQLWHLNRADTHTS